jgi:hypothetical protein
MNNSIGGQTMEQEKSWNAQVKKMSMDMLTYTKKDLIEVIDVQTQSWRYGHCVPKLGRYTDELHAVCAEIRRRQSK